MGAFFAADNAEAAIKTSEDPILYLMHPPLQQHITTSPTMKALLLAFLVSQFASPVLSFPVTKQKHPVTLQLTATTPFDDAPADTATTSYTSRRRSFLTNIIATTLLTPLLPNTAQAAQRQPLNELLYRILRVREATQQETRLIKSGKFKDVQRANVKLAVRFMIENYRLNDAFVGASSYVEGGNNRRVEAGQIGQATVQNLYTILEYFDASDVENIKVGQSSMAGKEELVLRGMDATRKGIDDFLVFFPSSEVQPVQDLIEDENRLNEKEFDPSFGQIVNLPTKRS